jgi:acetolactate synthase-1/2/3 large subunit
MKPSPDGVADVVARVLKARGVARVFALCGGHIMPIWMRLDAHGIGIVDVRDERAAVHMAQARVELTGSLGVALVTAGPGVTNAMTGIANAHVSRAPLLIIAGANPRPQENSPWPNWTKRSPAPPARAASRVRPISMAALRSSA